MVKNIISVILVSILFIGCDAINPLAPVATLQSEVPGYDEGDDRVLNVYWDYETLDANGYYHYPYQGYNYGTIYYEISNVNNYTLVGWTSPDEFCVDHFGTEICEPVINYQTYSDEYGNGQQNFYMNDTFIGDTLTLVGYLNSDVYDAIYVIIK